MDKKEIIEIVKSKNIKFIEMWFTDILGRIKTFTITANELPEALETGMGFDGSSVEGFARIYESDLIAKPDPDSFKILPYKENTAKMVCDIYTPEGTPYEGDPRYCLKRNLEQLKNFGFDEYYVGPELEYFYFKSNKLPEIVDTAGYFDSMPGEDAGDLLRTKTIEYLESMGIQAEYAHHEVAPSQHEIDLKYDSALKMADKVITYKVVVKEVARQNGLYATFMPKPITGVNGSGMHVHQSLFKNGKNTFFSEKDKYHLSDVAKWFIAGILRHCREICIVTNQWVNSYKRLVPGYEAPVYICWASKNRSALIRVPEYKPGKEKATRIEVRFPDPACNPYLAFAVMLRAGLEGIKNKYPLPEPLEVSAYEMEEIERKARKIEELPGSLIEAIEIAEESKLLKETLGEHIFLKFLENKKIEWDNYRTKVTDYEINRYFYIL
ncbi:MAG: glutamine synthetase family protein [Elusimicrobiota bacterium]|nr:glutamine synthetase family protein [Endomicrobiia bacterium]MDW8165325.1 glutamine synthetase family protein [Elusimicrobiota bacterium]